MVTSAVVSANANASSADTGLLNLGPPLWEGFRAGAWSSIAFASGSDARVSQLVAFLRGRPVQFERGACRRAVSAARPGQVSILP